MTALTCSRRNSSTSSTLPETRTGECWYGLEGPRHHHLSPRQPLYHRCNRSSRGETSRHKQPLHQHRIPQTRNDGNSPSCSVIWWTLRSSPVSSTPKSTGKSSVPIKRLVLKSSSAMKGTLPNSLGMECWSILAIRRPMRMTPNEQYGLVLEFSHRWKT